MAIELLENGDTLILMGGKIKPFHTHSEAELMRDYITHRLPQHHVLYSVRLESASSTTIHNVKEAVRLYGNLIMKATSRIVITSAYHAKRTALTWRYELKKLPFRMEICESTGDGLKTKTIELIATMITHLFYHRVRFPEYAFRRFFRTPKKKKS